jgi:hypothetical protein
VKIKLHILDFNYKNKISRLYIETASLVLSTLNSDYQNDNYTIITWNNLNLKTILGTMYDKYDKFNIELVSISQIADSYDFGETFSDVNVLIQLSGLSFVNNNYSVINKHNTNSTIIAPYNFHAYDLNNLQFFRGSVRTFIKDSNYIINLTITYLRNNFDIVESLITNVLDISGNNLLDVNGDPIFQGEYPSMVFIFKIYGIPNDKNNHNGSRMLISN